MPLQCNCFLYFYEKQVNLCLKCFVSPMVLQLLIFFYSMECLIIFKCISKLILSSHFYIHVTLQIINVFLIVNK